MHPLCFIESVVRQGFGTGHAWVKVFPYPDGMIANQLDRGTVRKMAAFLFNALSCAL